MSDRIEFKLSALVFRCLHGTAPAYTYQTSYIAWPTAAQDGGCGQHLRPHWWFRRRV